YLVTAECAVLLGLLPRRDGPQRGWLAAFLVAVGVAALAAGTVHGFWPDPASPVRLVLWGATMLALGFGALAAWGLGAGLLFAARGRRRMTVVTTAALAAYVICVLLVSQTFWLAIVFYLPAAAFLLVAFAVRGVASGVLGMALTFMAAGIQVGG